MSGWRRWTGVLVGLLATGGNVVAQPEPVLRIERDGVALRLQLGIDDLGMSHWRIEEGARVGQWLPIGPLTSLNGAGVQFLPLPGPGEAGTRFFRVVQDSSSANVLSLPATPYNYANPVLPPHLDTPDIQGTDNTPTNNPVSDAGATLGRVLFYDLNLSSNHAVSCASCHDPAHGFADPAPLSTGFNGEKTVRNAPGLISCRYYASGKVFWDERADSIEDQVLMTLQNEIEMGMDLAVLEDRLSGYGYYEELFEEAFGDAVVTSNRIARALAQFVRSIVTTQSTYDLGVAVEFANFTPQEELGRELFNAWPGNCSGCHRGPHFIGRIPDNDGLEYPYVDAGVGAITGIARDMGRFKTFSLRNIERTAPYMHDGRFATLEEVVDHYSTGIVNNPNLGGRLRAANYTTEERDALVAFMCTLTDDSLATDPRFTNPFRAP